MMQNLSKAYQNKIILHQMKISVAVWQGMKEKTWSTTVIILIFSVHPTIKQKMLNFYKKKSVSRGNRGQILQTEYFHKCERKIRERGKMNFSQKYYYLFAFFVLVCQL